MYARVLFGLALALSALLYGLMGLKLESRPGWCGVLTFLAVVYALYALYWLAYRTCHSARWILAAAVLFRLLLLPAGMQHPSLDTVIEDVAGRSVVYDRFLLYDNDIWRFLWDGHTQATGLNPYSYEPQQLEPYSLESGLDARLFPNDRWRDIWQNIGYKDIPTVYPPVTQLLFRLSHSLAPGSILVWKLLLITVDIGVCLVLLFLLRRAGLAEKYLLLYAWCPLVVKEVAGSGHADSLPALLLLLALLEQGADRQTRASFWLSLAVLAKLIPIVICPLAWRGWSWQVRAVSVLTVGAGYALFASAGISLLDGLGAYGANWIFNPGIFELVRWVCYVSMPSLEPTLAAKTVCGFIYTVFYGWLWINSDRHKTVDTWLLAIGVFLLLSSSIMPWYLVWVLALAVAAGRRSWIMLGALSMLSYWVYIRGDGVEEGWRLALIHILALLAIGRELYATKCYEKT